MRIWQNVVQVSSGTRESSGSPETPQPAPHLGARSWIPHSYFKDARLHARHGCSSGRRYSADLRGKQGVRLWARNKYTIHRQRFDTLRTGGELPFLSHVCAATASSLRAVVCLCVTTNAHTYLLVLC